MFSQDFKKDSQSERLSNAYKILETMLQFWREKNDLVVKNAWPKQELTFFRVYRAKLVILVFNNILDLAY